MRSLVTWRRTILPAVGELTGVTLLVLASLLCVSPASAAVDYKAILHDRLIDVRELLDRRQAHRSMLKEKIERFSRQLDQLQAEREVALEVLSNQEDQARAYELELDRLMPRLLPRLNHLDRLRKEGARAMAGLASMERNAKIKDRKRSRLLATQATSIEQMRSASTAVRLLRRVPNVMTARHRDTDFQIPLLEASVNRLDLQQSQLQRRRDAAVRDRAGLTVDIERLTAEEHRLARNILARKLEATDRPNANSPSSASSDRRGLGKATIGNADVRGIALRQSQPTPVARPADELQADVDRHAKAVTGIEDAALSSKSETSAQITGSAGQEKLRSRKVASLDQTESDNGIVARVDPGRIERKLAALVPTLEAIDYITTKDKHANKRQEIAIPALPNQPVAAADGGKVVFAGNFRSYGLLLIIEHGNGYHTLLWGFSSLDIKLGDTVQAGQIIGVMADGSSPKLHVELRRNGQPVSPEVWLAASNSGVKG